ncbi:MAG TPA: ribonuclease P Rpr2/Rpp21/SNM1 subunit [Candidatus Bilamarchaeaceae archaeon]|nr:ribonuclease P Rpr2/Rpp21/SNM1 subunit [Candidatus Bilamarchaeaceae archaeon]
MKHRGTISMKKFIKRVSAEAIVKLLDEAEKNAAARPARAKRYVEMAFALIKKHRTRLSRSQRLRFCKKCRSYWIPGKTVKIIFEHKRNAMVLACPCGAKRRIMLK